MSMLASREERGMRVSDFQWVQVVSIVERACRVWSGNGIWAQWVQQRYVKEVSLSNIPQWYNDSLEWRTILKVM